MFQQGHYVVLRRATCIKLYLWQHIIAQQIVCSLMRDFCSHYSLIEFLNDHKDQSVNDYILKQMRASFQCIIVCPCVCVCVSSSMHMCVPAVNNQISLFPCWAFSLYLVCFSLSIRICLKHLTGDFSYSGIGLFGFWLHSVSALILMN